MIGLLANDPGLASKPPGLLKTVSLLHLAYYVSMNLVLAYAQDSGVGACG